MRLLAARVLATFSALTWFLFPGFGMADLMASWDPDWPVVLEASWGLFMTVLVAASFATVAVRPRATATAQVTLAVVLGTWLVSAVAALEWELLGFAGLLVVEAAAVLALVPGRERVRPLRWSVRPPLLAVAAAAAAPWVLHAVEMYRLNRANVFEVAGDITMGTDHYAMQGALAVALVALSVLAACWPRGRRSLGVAVGLCSGYLGLVSVAHPGYDAALGTLWSILAMAWGVAVVALALPTPRSRRVPDREPAALG